MSISTRALALVLAAAGVGTFAAVAAPAAATASAATTTLQASVAADGSLASGSGVTATVAVGTGQYEITFDRDVTACAYVATTVNGSSQAVQAYTASGHSSANGVFVETKNQGGGLSAAAFDLVVDCGGPTTPFAVVGYDGALARGSAGATVTTLGPGQYGITFRTSVAACVSLASVGDPADGVVFDPTGVSTGVGANQRTVYVETKNPGGGLQTGVPFHLVVLCPGAAGVSAAAVRSDGVAARSVGDALTFRSANGRYTVVTRGDISGCATIATRGSLTRAAPYNPTTVETVAGPAANTVGVQVRTLLASGGGFVSETFYVATVC